MRYDEVAKTLVPSLKYQDRTDLAPTHGTLDGARGRRVACRCRRARFGAAALAADLARPLQPVGRARRRHRPPERREAEAEFLERSRATERQVGLSRAPRASNVQGAFGVPVEGQGEVSGARIVLIDDVLTSGATVDACARALLRAKAAQADMLVFARVVGSPKAPI